MLDNFINWLEGNMMPCFYKQYLGMECPGCGFQRSLALLLKGEFTDSFLMFPPLIPMLLMVVFLIIHLKFKFRNGAKWLLVLFVFNVCLLLGNFIARIAYST